MSDTRLRLDKQIQKAGGANQFPLSDGSGELQYADINAIVRGNETLSHLNSAEVVNGNLVIKFTGEDGNQQVVSTALNFSAQDIKVSDAKMENPSAGVYRLIITESDGSTYPVDLSALLAVVTQNTEQVTISGNGTPGSPLTINLTDQFLQKLPKVLDNLDDVTIDSSVLNEEVAKGGSVVLVWNTESGQWIPKSVKTLEDQKEITEIFLDVFAGNVVQIKEDISKIDPQSVKVFRNGMRQAVGSDYELGTVDKPKDISFGEPFSDKYKEKVIVDYRLLPQYLQAA